MSLKLICRITLATAATVKVWQNQESYDNGNYITNDC